MEDKLNLSCKTDCIVFFILSRIDYRKVSILIRIKHSQYGLVAHVVYLKEKRSLDLKLFANGVFVTPFN